MFRKLFLLLLCTMYSNQYGKIDSEYDEIVIKVENDSIWYGDFYVHSKTDLENFRYSQITGNLIVEYLSEVKDLIGLEELKTIGGELIIQNNRGLRTLTGLNNLTQIGGQIFIVENWEFDSHDPNIEDLPGLQNIDALENITVVNGDLYLFQNEDLLNLEGFKNICTIKGSLSIITNLSLENLNGLRNLNSVEMLRIHNSYVLKDISGLNNLESVNSIQIWRIDALKNIEGFNKINEVGSIEILTNTSLQKIDAFRNLHKIGYLMVIENNLLNDLICFDNLQEAGGINFWDNISLSKFCSLYNILSIDWDGWLEIRGNAVNPTKEDILYNGPCIPSNNTPFSNAGVDTNYILGEIVELDGSGSYDLDSNSITYSWSINYLPNGSTVELKDTNSVNPYFIPDVAGNYIISLVVNDGIIDSEIDEITIFVKSLEQAIEDLENMIINLDLPNGTENSFLTSLKNAQKSLEKGNTVAAINQLESLINKIEAQSGKTISKEQANILVAAIQRLINAIKNGLSKSIRNEEEVVENIVPKNFILNQNYPNPFNPTTKISYSIPENNYVTLIVYDVLGNVVSLLENGYKSAGNYTYNFDASRISNGVYFYKLQAGDFTETKKMILMK